MLAALVAAVVTSVFATYLVRRVDDRRIMDAALVLAVELTDAAGTDESIADVVIHADREMGHTGISFAVFDGQTLERLAGLPYERAILWTFKENDRAIGFYEHHGWTADGNEKRHARADAIAVRYRRPL